MSVFSTPTPVSAAPPSVPHWNAEPSHCSLSAAPEQDGDWTEIVPASTMGFVVPDKPAPAVMDVTVPLPALASSGQHSNVEFGGLQVGCAPGGTAVMRLMRPVV